MTCPSCSGPLVPANPARETLIVMRNVLPQLLPSGMFFGQAMKRLGLFDHCADCFWWRVALLLGYCAV